MTQEEIIEMAKQSGIDIGMWEKLSDDDDVFGYSIDGTHENLESFAKLVAKRTWVGLTDEEIWETISRIGTSDSDVNPYAKLADARAIEAKLKDKNNV